MNLVTFNDKIKEMAYQSHNSHNPSGLDKVEQLFPKWETSPLFLYDEPSNEAETTAIVKVYGTDVFEAVPFPVFRLGITVGETGHKEYGKYQAKALVAWYEDGPCVFARIDDLLHNKITYQMRHDQRYNEMRALPITMLVSGVKQTKDNAADFFVNANLLFGMEKRWVYIDETKPPPPWVTTYINGLLKSLAAFNLSAMSPNTHIAKVSPMKGNKSIHWQKARTHYTIITHGHPANNPTVAHGSHVSGDSKGEITRMAHNRRAHQRTLRSARFRYARGKTIMVKATWVGPKEWRDFGSKQIYRILEPIEP